MPYVLLDQESNIDFNEKIPVFNRKISKGKSKNIKDCNVGELNMSKNPVVQTIETELTREKKMLHFFEQRKKQVAPGSLTLNKQQYSNYCYQKTYVDGKRHQIFLDRDRDEDIEIIKELMEKKTLVHATPILRKNVEALEQCLTKFRPYSPLDYEYGELLGKSYYLDGDVCYKEWKKKEDCKNPFHKENCIHETKSGKKVRSKSEVLIADTLFDLKIEFKYEPELVVDGKIIYPDFEFFHPKEKKLIWWDHLGKLDDPGYAFPNINRIAVLGKNGIRLGENLIITTETKEKPLTHREVDRELKYFGLLESVKRSL